MPAVELPGADGRADAHAVIETVIETHAGADARADARTDDGDARAHTGTVRGTHTCAVAKTVYSIALLEADASALLLVIVLERPDYGCDRLRCLIRSAFATGGALGPVAERIRISSIVETFQ